MTLAIFELTGEAKRAVRYASAVERRGRWMAKLQTKPPASHSSFCAVLGFFSCVYGNYCALIIRNDVISEYGIYQYLLTQRKLYGSEASALGVSIW